MSGMTGCGWVGVLVGGFWCGGGGRTLLDDSTFGHGSRCFVEIMIAPRPDGWKAATTAKRGRGEPEVTLMI